MRSRVEAGTSATPAAASTAATRRARRAWWSSADASRCSARRSSAPTSPTSCTPRRSPIVGELTMDQLWHAVPAFPTRSEVWLNLLEAWERESA